MGTFTLKRLTLTTVFLLLGFLAIHAVDDDDLITKQITVKLDQAGTLPARIGYAKKFKITNLKIVGDINGTDVLFIREMAGSDYYGDSTNGKLAILDLSDVKIVEGGDCYYNSGLCYTKKDIVGHRFFSDCSSLTNVEIPSSVTAIETCSFYKCGNLTSINIPMGVTSIGNNAFSYCSNLTSICIPSSVTHIYDQAFDGCSSLTSIEIHSGLTWIGDFAFRGCSSLASIDMPSSLINIGAWAFNGCSSLTSVYIPLGVTSIDRGAFMDCTGLTRVYVSWKSPLRIDEYSFENIDKTTCILYVPQGTKDDYWLSNWGDAFDNIVEYDVTGIGQVVNGDSAKELSRYSVDGKRLDAPVKGLNIVKYSDGSVKKIAVQ